jgi:membrane-bound lytic murein transglycosylase A
MLLALVFLFGSHAHAQFEVDATNYTTPLKKMAPAEYPRFSDDLDLADLEIAIHRQLVRFQSKSLTGTINMGGHKYPLKLAKDSLDVFMQLVTNFKSCATIKPKNVCYDQLNAEIVARFDLFKPDLKAGDPRYGQPNDSFFTGYHTHPIDGRSQPVGEYKHAIYKNPGAPLNSKTREEIDFRDGLKGKGLEIVYTKDLFDLYLLHVEGGGYVTETNNGVTNSYYISYDGQNGQKWNWISKYMMDRGYITNPSIAAQRKFLRLHPEKHEEIFKTCPSYVFYKVTAHPPTGCDMVSLVDGRAIATDSKLYAFKGLLAFVQTNRAVDLGTYDMEQEDATQIPYQPFARFFLDQDTGGAIVGKGRADIYFGKTPYAYYAASYQSQEGKLMYLMLKDPGP